MDAILDLFLDIHTSPLSRSLLVQPSSVCFLVDYRYVVFLLQTGIFGSNKLLGNSYDGCPMATRDRTITRGLGIAAFLEQ